LLEEMKQRGFSKVQICPTSAGEVVDEAAQQDRDARPSPLRARWDRIGDNLDGIVLQ
jgi:hypothetical protein